MGEMVELHIIATDAGRHTALSLELAHLPHVRVWMSYVDAVRAGQGLDATFVPLMSALEWGAIESSPPLHQTQVVRVPDHAMWQYRPRYAIPGVAIALNEQLTPFQGTMLILQESFKAIAAFNHANPSCKLVRVAAVDLTLGLDHLDPGQTLIALERVYLPVPPGSLPQPSPLRVANR